MCNMSTSGIVPYSIGISSASTNWWVVQFRSSSLQLGERSPDAHALVFGDEPVKHLPEMGMTYTRMDVLPPVSLQEIRFDRLKFPLVDCPAAVRHEIVRIGWGLRLQKAVDRGDQFDKLVDSLVAFAGRQSGIVTFPFEFVEDGVLA